MQRSEVFADHLLALAPQRVGVLRVERIGPQAFADGADFAIVGHDLADMAVFAIASADILGRRHDASPNARRAVGSRSESP